MSTIVDGAEAESPLVEIWHAISRRKLTVLMVIALVMLTAWVGIFFTSPQWEATAVVQIGKIGQKDQLIEPISKVLERVRLRSFQSTVIANAQSDSASTQDRTLYHKSLAVRPITGTDLIQITVRGFSPAAAKQFALDTAEHLGEVHEKASEPAIREIRERLRHIDAQLAQMDMERQRMLKMASVRDSAVEARFIANAILTNIVMQQRIERGELERSRMEYVDQLHPFRTYPTKIMESVGVSEAPVLPRKRLILTLAALLGIFLAVLVAVLANHFQQRTRGRN